MVSRAVLHIRVALELFLAFNYCQSYNHYRYTYYNYYNIHVCKLSKAVMVDNINVLFGLLLTYLPAKLHACCYLFCGGRRDLNELEFITPYKDWRGAEGAIAI